MWKELRAEQVTVIVNCPKCGKEMFASLMSLDIEIGVGGGEGHVEFHITCDHCRTSIKIA